MSFEVAAGAYDLFMGRYSLPLARRMLEWMRLPPAAYVLDVGCGPGPQVQALRDADPAGRVAAVDPSASFVAAMAGRYPDVEVHQATAEALPFPDGVFDAALAGLVAHFLTDPAAGFAEMLRVTRPGGRLGATVWDFAGAREPHAVFYRGLAAVTARADDQSDRTGASRGDLAALLRGAGASEVAETELTVEVPMTSFDDWWQPYTLGVSVAGRQLAALSEDDRERVRRHCREEWPHGPFTLRATAWAARGIRPE